MTVTRVLLVNAESIRTPLADKSVHCSAFSPPYFGLRKYAGKKQVRRWPEVVYPPVPGLPPLTIPAWRGSLGNEPTPEAFIGHLVLCCREVKRVLRDDGVAWVVIGDNHCSSERGNKPGDFSTSSLTNPQRQDRILRGKRKDFGILHQGDLLGIPARLMFALQADGWIVRSDVVWHKLAPMPESVFGTHWERHRIKVKSGRPPARQEHLPPEGQRESGLRGNGWSDVGNQPNADWTDCPGCSKCEANGGYVLRRGSWRHTRAHETVLQLTKQMHYWCDQEAVREGFTYAAEVRVATPKNLDGLKLNPTKSYGEKLTTAGRNPRDVLQADGLEELWLAFLEWMGTAGPGDCLTPRPESYSGDHYAVYPTSLLEPLIKAGCPAQCCPACGAGWAPVVEREGNPSKWAADDNIMDFNNDGRTANPQSSKSLHRNDGGVYYKGSVLGYRPTCSCVHDLALEYTADGPQTGAEWLRRLDEAAERLAPVPGIVFDPFVGSGSTLVETLRQGKCGVGADLCAEYLSKQARARLELDAWDAWHEGRDGNGTEAALEGLPLFGGLEG